MRTTRRGTALRHPYVPIPDGVVDVRYGAGYGDRGEV
jgi:hypothetical protein